MPDLLDRIIGELRERRDASRAAVIEYEQLQRALQALDGLSSDDDGSGSRRSSGRRVDASGEGKPRAERGRRAPHRAPSPERRRQRQRAPRGANRAAVMRVVSERPGVRAAEVASASGVKRTVVYNELRRLVEAGELVRQEMPSGASGYALASSQRDASPTEGQTS